MTRLQNHIEFLSQVADELGDLKDDVVFVGGTICGLLLTDTAVADVRPTDDVDFIVRVTTYAQYTRIQDRLRQRGFQDVVDTDGPICRMKVSGILVDVLPVNGEFLGFKNDWYERAIETAVTHTVKVGETTKSIRMVNAPLFICTKLDAFKDRGKGDFMASHDIEDVVAVLNGRKEIWKECWQMPDDVRQFLKESFESLLQNDSFLDALPGMLPFGSEGRDKIIKRRMTAIAEADYFTLVSGYIEFAFGAGPADQVEVAIISADKYSDETKFPTCILERKEDVLRILAELKITDYERPWAQKISRLYPVENVDTQLLATWGLLPPLIVY